MARSHRDLEVWHLAMQLAEDVYRLTKLFPKTEEYRLTAQVIRAAVSVPANIAEGNARGSRKDYARFVAVARGSMAETETLLLLEQRVQLADPAAIAATLEKAERVGRMLTALHRSLDTPNPQSLVPNPDA